LIQINFTPSSVDDYNTAVADLQNQNNTATDTAPQTTDPPTANQTTSPATSGCNCRVVDLPQHCDPNLSSTSDVTCRFAENSFYEYYKKTNGDPTQPASIQVWDATTHQYLAGNCSSGDGVVDCGYGKNADVRFNQTAISSYTPAQASTYEKSNDLGPSG